ncbi:MAG: Kae1-associated kinase Bud32 [Candidatus Aenigmarchaeota archaeon ex4484_56]|nr:MAG: Kae1-associated kinase Bud32 [Candidatus Aenigmarchaeota archaeon ex4484_56]
MKLISQGAEAVIYLENNHIIKKRIKKRYRIEQLDIFLRASRTRKEAKLLSEARRIGINTPVVYNVDKFSITMEFINGKKFAFEKNVENYCRILGESVSKLHKYNITHGDLTTANILIKNRKLYFIDFGLGMETKNIEQKAADLLTLYQNFKTIFPDKELWPLFIKGYRNKNTIEILNRFDKVLSRKRYL